jgi:NitT/TauT family transport system permease protein
VTLAAKTSAGSRPTWFNRITELLQATILNPRWLFIIIVLVVWQLVAIRMNTRVVPTPWKVATTMWRAIATGLFFENLAASMLRIAVGFSCSMLFGTTVGVLMGSRRSWNEFFSDLVTFGLALPGLIYALLSVMFFGISLLAPVVAIVGTSYPFVATNIREGVKALDKDLLDMTRAYKVDRWKVVRQVILPALLPFVLAAFRIGFSIAWKVTTLVEVFGAVNGVGYMIRGSFDAFSVAGIIAWALMFGGVMLAIEYGILLPAERHFARWRPRVEKVL